MIFLYRDHNERRRAPPRRESAFDEVSLKIPLAYIKKGEKIIVDYAVPKDEDSEATNVEQYVGALIAMDQHQNTLMELASGEKVLLRGARVIKIRFLSE